MSNREIKVGDVVAWADVPDGALVRVQQERYKSFWLRLDNDLGFQVGFMLGFNKPRVRLIWASVCPRDPVDRRRKAKATIVALDVPDHATAADLQRLAEVFEVREALTAIAAKYLTGLWRDIWDDAAEAEKARVPPRECQVDGCPGGNRCVSLINNLAERLHAAGWRPGMTAEDAARLLAQA